MFLPEAVPYLSALRHKGSTRARQAISTSGSIAKGVDIIESKHRKIHAQGHC